MKCAHLVGEPEHQCGKPAVAVWTHPIIGVWPLCTVHDRSATTAKYWSQTNVWTREAVA